MSKQKKIVRPRRVKIGEKNYKVVSRKYKSWNGNSKGKGKTWAQINYNQQLVELNVNQSPIELLDSLIHETLHGIIREYGIKVDGRKEEGWVIRIANGITDTYKNNPNLLRWIIATLEKEAEKLNE